MNKLVAALLSIVFIIEMVLSLYHFFDVSYLPAIYHMLISILLFKMINRSLLLEEIRAMGDLITKIKSEVSTNNNKAQNLSIHSNE